jgi:maleylacetate reductase
MIQGASTIHLPERIVFGRACADAVVSELKRAGATNAFILAPASLSDHPLVSTLRVALGETCVGLYSGCVAHTPTDAVLTGADLARKADAQALIAVGGGSVIDLAKMVRLCLDEELRTAEDLKEWRLAPSEESERRRPLLAVPTTLSAAEFSGIAGMLNRATGVKDIFHHPALLPDVVVLDPAATESAPDWLVLSTGIRAVDHCVETILSAAANPFADASALHGLELLVKGLPRMREQPGDRNNRNQLQFGMWLSMIGPGIGVPLGASHAIGRVLGGAFGIPHGRTSCVMLGAVLAWNASVDRVRQDRLRPIFTDSCSDLAGDVRSLVNRLGEPSSLRQLGVNRDDLENIVRPALQMLEVPSVSGNVRRIESPDDVREILAMAW